MCIRDSIKTDVYDNEIESLDKLGDELRHRAKMEGINLEIEVGQNTLLTMDFIDVWNKND